MKKSINLSFLLTFEFNDSYRTNRHGTKITTVKVTLADKTIVLWEGKATCKITKHGEVSWHFPDDCSFSLILKANAKMLYSDEEVNQIFNTMKEKKGLN